MNQEHRIYLNVVKNMVSSFNNFLTEAEKMEESIADLGLVDNLRETDATLRRILGKWDAKSSTRSDCSSPGNQLTNKRASSSEDELEHNSQNSTSGKPERSQKRTKENVRSRDVSIEDKEKVISKVLKYIKSDVDDDEEDHVKPENKDTKEENSGVKFVVSRNNLDSKDSFHDRVNNKCIKSSSKEMNVGSLTHKNEHYDEFISKIANDTFRCTLCEISVPANNVSSHANGKAHRSKKLSMSVRETSISRSQNSTDDEYGPHIKKSTFYYCEVCRVKMTSEGNVEQHISGAKHKQKSDSTAVIFSNDDYSQHVKKITFYYCEVCSVKMTSEGNVKQHISNDKHKQKCDS